MKQFFIAATIVLCTYMVGHAQYDEATTKKFREYMVMDGKNPDFILAQEQSPNKLTVGLPAPGEKGVAAYELRASCIWFTGDTNQIEHLLARLIYEEGNGLVTIVRASTDSCTDGAVNTNEEVIGYYEPNSGDIYKGDNAEQPYATIDISGKIIDRNGATLLKIDKANKLLVVYFLLEYYIPGGLE